MNFTGIESVTIFNYADVFITPFSAQFSLKVFCNVLLLIESVWNGQELKSVDLPDFCLLCVQLEQVKLKHTTLPQLNKMANILYAWS